MDWTKLIAELTAAKLTQARVAELCGVAQSTISDLARGSSKSPAWELGQKLVALRRDHCNAHEARDAA